MVRASGACRRPPDDALFARPWCTEGAHVGAGVIRPGETWGTAARGPADVTVCGGDLELAAAVAERPGGLFAFVPDETSDLARAVGLPPGAEASGTFEVPLDALAVDADGHALLAVNMVLAGAHPDAMRWWTAPVDVALGGGPVLGVVAAVGQFRAGLDLVPRGHPGDGAMEIHEYRLARSERAAMRRRLRTGTHVPHPRITTRRAHELVLTGARPFPVEVDGRRSGRVRHLRVTLVPAAYRLLL